MQHNFIQIKSRSHISLMTYRYDWFSQLKGDSIAFVGGYHFVA